MGFVYIRHPDVEGYGGPVTEEAFEQIHSRKGWELADSAAVAASEFAGRFVGSLDSLSADELSAFAATQGVRGVKKKADLVAALSGVAPAAPAEA